MPFEQSDSEKDVIIDTEKNKLLGANSFRQYKSSGFEEKSLPQRSTADKTKQMERSSSRELTTSEKHKIVGAIALIMVMSNIVFVQMGPFYPLLVAKKGIDTFYVGIVFGTMASFQIFI